MMSGFAGDRAGFAYHAGPANNAWRGDATFVSEDLVQPEWSARDVRSGQIIAQIGFTRTWLRTGHRAIRIFRRAAVI